MAQAVFPRHCLHIFSGSLPEILPAYLLRQSLVLVDLLAAASRIRVINLMGNKREGVRPNVMHCNNIPVARSYSPIMRVHRY